jgi:hypothetical protein
LEFAAAKKRQRSEYERDVALAYMVEFMARQKELSGASMKKLLSTGKQTPAEQRLVLEAMAARYGLKLQRRRSLKGGAA